MVAYVAFRICYPVREGAVISDNSRPGCCDFATAFPLCMRENNGICVEFFMPTGGHVYRATSQGLTLIHGRFSRDRMQKRRNFQANRERKFTGGRGVSQLLFSISPGALFGSHLNSGGAEAFDRGRMVTYSSVTVRKPEYPVPSPRRVPLHATSTPVATGQVVMRSSELPSRNTISYPSWALSLLVLALPAIVLGLLAQRTRSFEITVGAGVLTLFLLVFIRNHPVWRPPVSASVVILYLMALVWAWLPLRG
jgi:hypothetical protein